VLHAGGDVAAAVAAPWCASLKLAVHPATLPPSGLRPAALAALAALRHPRVAALQACVRAGCTLLTFDAVVDDVADAEAAGGGGDGGDGDGDARAATALRAMLAADGAAGAFLRGQATVHLALGSGGAASAAVGVLLPPPPGGSRPPRRLPPLQPLALLSTAAGELRLAPGGAGGAEAPQALPRLVCRLHGRYVPLQARGHVACVPATGAEGVALLDLAPAESGDGDGDVDARPCPASPRPVLLTRDAAIAAEVAAAAAALPADAAAARGALEAAVLALGHALRPGCATPLLARAAIEALHRGWAAAARRLVPGRAGRLTGAEESGGSGVGHSPPSAPSRAASAAQAPPGDDGAYDDVAAPYGVTLLHAAAASGSAELAALVLRCGGPERRFGAAATPGPDGATPLHLACSADGAAVAELLTAAAGGDDDTDLASADDAAEAVLAWFTAHDDAGRTPSRMAAAAGASAALAALDATLQRRMRAGSRLARALAAALLAETLHAAAREAPVARARRAADVARGSLALPLGEAAADELERAARDARAVAAALLSLTANGIEECEE